MPIKESSTFNLALDASGLEEVGEDAGFNPEQIKCTLLGKVAYIGGAEVG